jgi:hypothetical protein
LNICLSEMFGCRLMDHAQKYHLLHPSHQYGSWNKGKMCISAAVLLKCISYNHIVRQTRMDAIMFDNDARAWCYDRIIPSLAAMMSRRASRMTWNAAHVMIRLLLKMEYHVRTAYWVASIAFSNMRQKEI